MHDKVMLKGNEDRFMTVEILLDRGQLSQTFRGESRGYGRIFVATALPANIMVPYIQNYRCF
jgi:hypothetical protein